MNDKTAKGAPEFKVPTSDPSVAPKTSEEQVNTAADSGNQTLQPAQVINDGANEASNEVADHKTRGKGSPFFLFFFFLRKLCLVKSQTFS